MYPTNAILENDLSNQLGQMIVDTINSFVRENNNQDNIPEDFLNIQFNAIYKTIASILESSSKQFDANQLEITWMFVSGLFIYVNDIHCRNGMPSYPIEIRKVN